MGFRTAPWEPRGGGGARAGPTSIHIVHLDGGGEENHGYAWIALAGRAYAHTVRNALVTPSR